MISDEMIHLFKSYLTSEKVVPPPWDQLNERADETLADITALAMREKLEKKRTQGRSGWWDEGQCAIPELRTMLRDHLEKGDMLDVVNLAAMIYVRERMQ